MEPGALIPNVPDWYYDKGPLPDEDFLCEVSFAQLPAEIRQFHARRGCWNGLPTGAPALFLAYRAEPDANVTRSVPAGKMIFSCASCGESFGMLC